MSATNFSYSLSSTLHIQAWRIPLSTHSIHYLCLPGPVTLLLLLGYFSSLSLVSASALTHDCPQPSSQSDPITRCQKMSLSYTNPSSGFQLTQRGGFLWSMSPPLFSDFFLPQWPPGCSQHTQASCLCLRAFVLAVLSASKVISSDILFPTSFSPLPKYLQQLSLIAYLREHAAYSYVLPLSIFSPQHF